MATNRFCGPYALSYFLNKTPYQCANLVKKLRIKQNRKYHHKEKPVRGVAQFELIEILENAGLKVNQTYYGCGKRPTLISWYFHHRCGGSKTRILHIRDHFIVVDGIKIYDNHYPRGILIYKCPYQRRHIVCDMEVS